MDTNLKSKVWNDKKITAHHAIIPTGASVDVTRMKPDEKKLYALICQRYLAQFYPCHEYDQTTIELTVDNDVFAVKGRIVRIAGWKSILAAGNNNTEQNHPQLPPFSEQDQAYVTDTQIKDKLTQPPGRYTEGTLIQAMKNVGKAVADQVLKKLLKETSGLGTEATRASIIETLLKRGFINKQKKYLISSDTARALIDALPEPIKDPATTAVWEQALDDIAQGKRKANQFVQDQAKMVRTLTEQVKQGLPQAFTEHKSCTPLHACPACQHPLIRRKGKTGWFLGMQSLS